MESVRAQLAAACERLAGAGVPTPGPDAELLLAHVTGRPRMMLRLGPDLDHEQVRAFATLVERRAAREPLQHLTGRAPFRRLDLSVGPGTFVPRPETELLVDEVLRFAARSPAPEPVAEQDLSAGRSGPPRPPLLAVDLCTGSGALALAIATEVPGAQVHAVELSAAAVQRARSNAAEVADALAALGSSVEVVPADATAVADPGGPLAGLRGRVDVVVSNPPYVPDGMVPRDPEVRDHDPAMALFGGPDGLDVVRLVLRQSAALLRPGGLLVVEHADVQGEDAGSAGLPGLLRAVPGQWQDVVDHLDLTDRPRFTTAVRAGTITP